MLIYWLVAGPISEIFIRIFLKIFSRIRKTFILE
jgi:hypothetical protein